MTSLIAETEAQRQDVEKVLDDLLGTEAADRAPIVEVWNKIDLVDQLDLPAIEAEAHRAANRGARPFLTSAVTGQGLDDLCERIDAILSQADIMLKISLPANAGKLRNWLYENAAVLQSTPSDDANGSTTMRVRVSLNKHGQLLHQLEALGLSAAHD